VIPISDVRNDMSHGSRDELRRSMRQARMALAAADRVDAARAVSAHLAQWPALGAALRVGAYWAMRGELPLSHVLTMCYQRGQIALLPVLAPADCLRFAPWLPGEPLLANRFGIPEPEHNGASALDPHALDVVLVPLLAFDRRGNRLGTGGGWYDRSFAFLHGRARPAKTVLVGVGYAFQEVPMLPVADHDVRMDCIVTERELIDCHTVPH
jgi:5-formyltetrahydrofolate cyclo-ligase